MAQDNANSLPVNLRIVDAALDREGANGSPQHGRGNELLAHFCGGETNKEGAEERRTDAKQSMGTLIRNGRGSGGGARCCNRYSQRWLEREGEIDAHTAP